MKKTISLVLALMLALVAIFSISMLAFADGEGTNDAAGNDTGTTTSVRNNERQDEATKATESTTTTTKSDEAAIVDKLTTKETTTIPNKVKEDNAETVTGGTAVVDEPISTRKPASTNSNIPNTGSSVAVTAIAVLALTAGTVAVVKTKKDN